MSLIAKKSRRRRRHVELYPSLHVLRVVLLDVFYGDRERGRCVFRRRMITQVSRGGNSKNDRILCPLRPLCFTLAVDLRDTTRRGRFSKATTPFLLEGLS